MQCPARTWRSINWLEATSRLQLQSWTPQLLTALLCSYLSRFFGKYFSWKDVSTSTWLCASEYIWSLEPDATPPNPSPHQPARLTDQQPAIVTSEKSTPSIRSKTLFLSDRKWIKTQILSLNEAELLRLGLALRSVCGNISLRYRTNLRCRIHFHKQFSRNSDEIFHTYAEFFN